MEYFDLRNILRGKDVNVDLSPETSLPSTPTTVKFGRDMTQPKTDTGIPACLNQGRLYHPLFCLGG